MRARTIIAAALLSACLATNASAGVYFYAYQLSVGGTTERVRTFAQVATPVTCPLWPAATVNCIKNIGTLRVTPCPAGLPCTNGAYEFTYDMGWGPFPPELDLDLGKSYTFQFHVVGQYAYGTGPCSYTCTDVQDATPFVYTTQSPSEVAQLNVAVLSASVDTVWVELSASGVDTQKCTDYCGYSVLETYFEVSPCALAAPVAYNVCQNGITKGEISVSRKLGLKPGVTYTMWASFQRYGFSYSPSDQGCTNQACLYQERTPNLVYTPVITATTPITWGAVKAMYR